MGAVGIKWPEFLFILSVQFFGLFDGLSTFALIQRYPIAYETSFFLRKIYLMLGPVGLLLVKISLTIFALSLAYFLFHFKAKWRYMCIGIMNGALIAGLLAGTSNMLLLINGSSIYLFSLNTQQLCLITIFTLSTLGLIADIKNAFKHTEEYSATC
ncbi:MAG: hypothetical protein QXJ68_08125 [Methanocellales archaeon]